MSKERVNSIFSSWMGWAGHDLMVIASSDVIAPAFHEVQERAVKLANDTAFTLAKEAAQAKDPTN